MSKLPCDIRCIVVRFYCSNEDVKYGFNFKVLRDKRIKVIHFFETNVFGQVYFTTHADSLVTLTCFGGSFT